jgi:hypothetical protein
MLSMLGDTLGVNKDIVEIYMAVSSLYMFSKDGAHCMLGNSGAVGEHTTDVILLEC